MWYIPCLFHVVREWVPLIHHSLTEKMSPVLVLWSRLDQVVKSWRTPGTPVHCFSKPILAVHFVYVLHNLEGLTEPCPSLFSSPPRWSCPAPPTSRGSLWILCQTPSSLPGSGHPPGLWCPVLARGTILVLQIRGVAWRTVCRVGWRHGGPDSGMLLSLVQALLSLYGMVLRYSFQNLNI